NALERHFAEHHGIRPNPDGLLDDAAAHAATARLATGDLGAEPGLWLPWQLWLYDGPPPSSARAAAAAASPAALAASRSGEAGSAGTRAGSDRQRPRCGSSSACPPPSGAPRSRAARGRPPTPPRRRARGC